MLASSASFRSANAGGDPRIQKWVRVVVIMVRKEVP